MAASTTVISHPFHTVSDPTGFASALAGRGVRRAVATPLEAVLARTVARAPIVVHHHHAHRWTVAPAVGITLSHATRNTLLSPATQVLTVQRLLETRTLLVAPEGRPSERAAAALAPTLHQVAPAPGGAPAPLPLQLLAASRQAASPGDAPSPALPLVPQPAPVRQILRRSRPAAQPPAQARPAGAASAASVRVAPAGASAWAERAPTPAMAADARSVERLTDHVLRAIDRRVIAQRERMGGG
jgi:hypothetical protein